MPRYFTIFFFLCIFLACEQEILEFDNDLDPTNPDYEEPQTTILSQTPPLGTNNSIGYDYLTINWDGNTQNMEFQYRLDQKDWSPWQLEKYASLSYLDEGEHFFFVRGRYLSGDEELEPDTLVFGVDAVDGPSIRVFPLLSEVTSGEDFTFEIWAEEVTNIAGMEIVLRYNMQMLTIDPEDITVGAFFGINGGSVLNFNSIDYEAGFGTITIDIGVYSGSPEFVAGSGPVVVIEANSSSSGETDIEFIPEMTTIRQSNNVAVTIEKTVDGKVMIE